jgi:hypothetical protein
MVQPNEPLPRTDKNYYFNEQLRITSEPIVRKVVDRLGLRTKYVQEGMLLDWDVYKETPIHVELDTNSLHNPTHLPYGVAFYLHDVKGDDFTLTGDGKYGPEDLDRTGATGQIRRMDQPGQHARAHHPCDECQAAPGR